MIQTHRLRAPALSLLIAILTFIVVSLCLAAALRHRPTSVQASDSTRALYQQRSETPRIHLGVNTTSVIPFALPVKQQAELSSYLRRDLRASTINSTIGTTTRADHSALVNSNRANLSFRHFASFASNIVDTAVDLRINGTKSIFDLQFEESVGNLTIPAQSYTIEVLPAGIGIVIADSTFPVESEGQYVVSLIGNGIVQPIELAIHAKEIDSAPSQAKLRFLHYAAFQAIAADTTVSLCTDQDILIQENIQYNSYSDPYLLLSPGVFDLKLVGGTSGCTGEMLYDLEPIELSSGSISELYFVGDQINQPFETFLIDSTPDTLPTPTQTDIPTPVTPTPVTPTPVVTETVTHTPSPTGTAIPTITPAITPTITPVPTFTQFPTATPSPTDTLIPTNTSVPVKTATPVITATPIITATPTVIATPTIGQPPTSTAVPTATPTPVATPSSSEYATLTIANFAPFADTPIETNVTVRVIGAEATAEFEIIELTFGSIIGNLPIKAGDYHIEIVPTDTNVVVVDKAITVAPNTHYTLALIGNGSIQPLDLYFEPQNNRVTDDAKAPLSVVNFVPIARDLSETAIDVCTVDGEILQQNLQYGSAISPTLMLEPKNYYFKFTKTGTNCTEIITEIPRLALTSDRVTRIFVVGDRQNQPFEPINASTRPLVVTPEPTVEQLETPDVTPTSEPPMGTESRAHYLALIVEGSNVESNDGPPILNSDGITTSSGLRVIEIRVGDGAYPQPEQFVEVHYKGWLADGTRIRNTYRRSDPVKFQIGVGNLIEGWEEGLQLIRAGGKSRLIIPPELGYGAEEVGGIPAGSTLIYDVELIGISDAISTTDPAEMLRSEP